MTVREEIEAGSLAYRAGLPFDESRSDPWKRGWVIGKEVYGTDRPKPSTSGSGDDADLVVTGLIGIAIGGLLF